MRRPGKRSALAHAFTLTEMMVVLVIIGLIAAIVGPRLFNRLDTAKQRTAHVQIENLVSAVNLFRIDTGRLPTRDEGLDVLIHATDDGSQWLGPYLAKDQLPLDPWGHPYVYNVSADGKRYTILSYGSFGHPGGSGADKPITSDEGKPTHDGNGASNATDDGAGSDSTNAEDATPDSSSAASAS
jgi:general secretion pathway protein G